MPACNCAVSALREANYKSDLSEPCTDARQYGQWRKPAAGLPDLRKMGKMARKPLIRIALVERDPLRVVGFRALFESESGFELVSASLPDIGGCRALTWGSLAIAEYKTSSI